MPQVFISYAKEDIEMAKKLRNHLHDAGVSTWLDVFDLRPGERWRNVIRKEIKKCSYFIALISNKSVGKRGFVQKELREAISIAEEFPQDEIFIIPVRINECIPPHEDLQELQRVDLFPSYYDGFQILRQVLKSEIEHTSEGITKQGIIEKITDRGFGFIKDEQIEKGVFFMLKDFKSPNISFIQEGMYVRYQIKPGPLGVVAKAITFA